MAVSLVVAPGPRADRVPEILVCPECGSCRVQIAAWINPHTEEIEGVDAEECWPWALWCDACDDAGREGRQEKGGDFVTPNPGADLELHREGVPE